MYAELDIAQELREDKNLQGELNLQDLANLGYKVNTNYHVQAVGFENIREEWLACGFGCSIDVKGHQWVSFGAHSLKNMKINYAMESLYKMGNTDFHLTLQRNFAIKYGTFRKINHTFSEEGNQIFWSLPPKRSRRSQLIQLDCLLQSIRKTLLDFGMKDVAEGLAKIN